MTLTEPLSIALLLVLVLQPLSPMNAGFWLSFFVVGFIFYVLRLAPPGRLNLLHWLAWHGVLSIGLVPMTALFFSFASPLSVPANFFAVPLLTLLVVPLVLLGMVLLFVKAPVGEFILQIAATLLQVMLDLLEWLAGFSVLQWWPAGAPGWSYACAVAAVVVLFLPRGTGLDWLALPLSAALWLPNQPLVPDGEFAVSVIDVG